MSKFPDSTKYRTSATFKNRILQLIDDNDCSSNQEFADKVGVSVPVISKAVNFCIVPTSRTLIKIADKLQLSFKYLLGLTDKNDFIASATPTTFSKRIDELTKKRKSNYGRVTSTMEFPRNYIYEWRKEGTIPSVDYILDLADYFNVSPDYLLGRTDYEN